MANRNRALVVFSVVMALCMLAMSGVMRPPQLNPSSQFILDSSSSSSTPDLLVKRSLPVSTPTTAQTLEDFCASYQHDRFLVIIRSVEQMGKAEGHLLSMAELAYSSNRTMVLPNFSGGYMVFQGSTPLEEIYDLTTFPKDVKWITGRDYISCHRNYWNKNRPHMTYGMVVVGSKGAETNKNYRLTREALKNYRLHVSGPSRVDMIGSPPLEDDELVPTVVETEKPAILGIMRGQTTHMLLSHLLVDDWYRWHVPKETLFHLHPRWHEGAKAFREAHGPYVAVHWRMEEATEDLSECAEVLADYIEEIKKQSKVEAVYVASDVTLDGIKQTVTGGPTLVESGTKALKVLVDRVGKVLWWENFVPYVDTTEIRDPYIIAAVMDRAALMYGTRLIRGPPGCAKRTGSSFTEKIAQWRQSVIDGEVMYTRAQEGQFRIDNGEEIWPALNGEQDKVAVKKV